VLALFNTEVTQAGAGKIRKALPNCDVLRGDVGR